MQLPFDVPSFALYSLVVRSASTGSDGQAWWRNRRDEIQWKGDGMHDLYEPLVRQVIEISLEEVKAVGMYQSFHIEASPCSHAYRRQAQLKK
jgi:hypothetical protein